MNRRRVVITGLGCVTALAESAEEVFAALCQAESGISQIESFDVTEFPVKFGGEIKNFVPKKYINPREAKRMDRFTQFAAASAVQAVADSGIDFKAEDKHRVGVLVGTGIGGLKEIEDQHKRILYKSPRKVSPFCVPRLMANAASGYISILYGLKGTNICIVTACASASHSIGEAFYNIIADRSDVALKSLSTRNDNPQIASRPFDKDRDGFVLSEGGGIVILEEYEHAKKRGARIYCELLGYGATGDGYHITAPDPDGNGAAEAMRLALTDANLKPEKIDYINAHGTSTELNDVAESLAIKSTFGDHAYKLAVSSTKGCLGHLLGASGAVEVIVMAKVVEKAVIPPTANLENVDKHCDRKIDYVPRQARQANVDYAMSNSLGFGGHNCCLVVGKV
jgi:3-oxoacyl-[acyl-carrier-protein] synthase II